MYIKDIILENFRCFECLDVYFPEDYAVLIGTNGAGKSSILDALAIALGAFLAGCNVPATNLHKSDVRFLPYTHEGGSFHREARYPVSVSVGVKTDKGIDIDWERALNSANGRTTVREARPIMDYADALCYRVQENMPVTLPMLAYYGTGRLWLPKREKKGAVMRGVPSRLHGYVDALDAATNEKLMLQWFKRNALIVLQKGKVISTFEAVKKVMADFYREMDEAAESVQVDYDIESAEIEIYVKRKNEDPVSLPLRYFSDGIKAMLSMTADIAYRIALLNPNLGGEAMRETPGIVLIDEIDMHLHPSWQRKILASLKKVFPRIQFIVTTHAPAVLANVPRENIIVFSEGKAYPPAEHTYGRDVNTILRDVMGTEVRPQEVMEKKDLFYKALDEGDFSAAEKQLGILEKILGQSDEEVVYMTTMLDLER